MVSITLSVPVEVKHRMESFPEMNWSGFVREKIVEKTEDLSWKEETLKKLKQDKGFEEWCVEMGEKVNKGIAKKLKKEGLI
ncbi:MAG: hypothetical protein U9Q69_01945 [Nanoarchaeota archaeon]|nr:hypothetical protein [Nanoarchaeota archaeon]